MPIKESEIVEADAEVLYDLDIPVRVKNDDGSTHEEKLSLKYRALTEERTSGLTFAAQLANVIAEWNVVGDGDKPVAPDFTYFAGKPLPYLRKLSEAISSDFFRRTGNSTA